MTQRVFRLIFVLGVGALGASNAFAWDPMAGAEGPPRTMPHSRYDAPSTPLLGPHYGYAPAGYTQSSYVPAATTYTPPAQTARQVPAEQPAQQAVYTPPPAPAYVPPPVAYVAPPPAALPVYAGATSSPAPSATSPAGAPGTANPYYYQAPAIIPASGYKPVSPAHDRLEASLGVEYFHDNYQEDVVDLDSNANYGSLTGSLTYGSDAFFGMLDMRASYGEDNYSSISGSVDNVPQWEFDNRILLGARTLYNARGKFTYFTGIGNRYYRDEFKGEVTNLNKVGYDRRIFQMYVPLGFNYAYQMESGWQLKPGFEFDYIFFGNVSSRLAGTGLAGLENVQNRQTHGVGLRGDFMIGKPATADSMGYEFGPFVRYWTVGDSNVNHDSAGTGWVEPDNQRVQVGAEAKILF